MVITFYGEGCFNIQSGDFTILTDPFDNKTGLTPPRVRPDVLIKTLTSISDVGCQPSEIANSIIGPGEYNVKNVNITGFSLIKESSEKIFKTVYLIEIEGIKICLLGHISEIPEPKILEHLEGINILFIPAGGSPFLDQKSAVKLIKHLQPQIVIPSFFKIPSLKRQTDDLKTFLEEFNGQKGKQTEPREKLTVKKKDFSEIKKTEIIILKP